ncbi:MAG: hypothetical protein Q8942_05115 [Bacillota bacterium]|nr:hypothetical protein [Bacillota bacterium]
MTYQEALAESSRYRKYALMRANEEETEQNKDRGNDNSTSSRHKKHKFNGTISRIYIPAGATFNYLNLIEATSPSGISLIVRIPFLGGERDSAPGNVGLSEVLDIFRAAGVNVEIEN